MKRSLCLLLFCLLLLIAVFAVSACGDTETDSPAPDASSDASSAPSTSGGGSTPGTNPPQEGVSLPGTVLTEGTVNLSRPTLIMDAKDLPQVNRAFTDLARDIALVSGQAPTMASDYTAAQGTVILAGTLEQSQTLKSVLGEDYDPFAQEKEDRWEAFSIRVVENLGGRSGTTVLVIGADMRGTIYGIYTLSELLGVSPWYWWADVPVTPHTTLPVTVLNRDEKPDVKYRGIFINDEETMEIWARAYETPDGPGSPGAAVYARVFELMLRLKANTLWPAMHATSDAFNGQVDPATGISYNAALADRYGIVMGSSHCEMLLCNNETEWAPWCEAHRGQYNLKKINNDWKASYDYTVNAEAMNAYWEDRVAANYRFENIYTLGLRGVHDSEILCSRLSDKSWSGKADVVRQAVEAQVAILKKYEAIYEKETGIHRTFATCYCAYKEAAEYFKYDLGLPESCLILFADDNYGYVRQLPTNTELETYAGAGVYYHVSYRGSPRSYLWIDTQPLSLIYEEMHKAYAAGANDLWILNVGDIKPAEFSTDFFLDLAWRESSVSYDTLETWMEGFFTDTFALTKEDAQALSTLHSEFLQIAYAYRPEFQGYGEGVEYSLTAYGDEAMRVINRMESILQKAAALYDRLDSAYRDAYYEIVLYRIRATLFTLQKNIYAGKNALALAQGRFASVNGYAAMAEAAYKQILADLNTYNALQNGKWRGIMDPFETVNGIPPITGAPKVTYLSKDMAEEGVSAAVEGQTGNTPITLTFDSLEDTKRFLDIFSTGLAASDFTVEATPGILVKNSAGETVTRGTVDVESRFWIGVDWSRFPVGTSFATLTVSDSRGHKTDVSLKIVRSPLDPAKEKADGHNGYYEVDGRISMEAEHYSDRKDVNGMYWKLIPHLGVSGGSMKAFPDSSAQILRIDGDYESESPYLEYQFYVTTPGKFQGAFYRIPTMNEGTTDEGEHKTCRIAYAFDGGDWDYFRGTSYVDTGYTSSWSEGVRYNYEIKSFTVTLEEGWHTLRIYMADAGTAFDKIVLRSESVPAVSSRLGCPETFNTIAWTPVPGGNLPEMDRKAIPFASSDGASRLLYDFTADASQAQGGYIGLDLSAREVRAKRYAWISGFETLKAAKTSASSVSLRDGGTIRSSSSATLRITLGKKGRYIVTLAVGDRAGNGFAVSGMSVTANGQTVLSDINQTPGTTCEYCFTVDLTDPILTLTFDGQWIVAALEILPYTAIDAPENAPAKADGNGDILLEAEWALQNSENFYSNTSTDGKEARFMLTGGMFGEAVYFGPNGGGNYTDTNPASGKGPRLHFRLELNAGTYSVFAYVKCEEDDDDSLILSLDNRQVQVANDFKQTGGVYKCIRIGTITVGEDGVFTLSVWGREDGLAIDRLIVTPKTQW